MTIIELQPIRDNPSEWDEIEKRIREFFKREIYLPIMRAMQEPQTALKNAKENPLYSALHSGRITFYRGVFSGKFNAGTSKELKKLGARWDRKSSTFRISFRLLPMETRNVISSTESRFREKIQGLDKTLSQMVPEELVKRLSLSDKFNTTLWKIDKEFQNRVRGLAVAPQLTEETRKKIADNWQNNIELYIKDFTKDQIKKLRSDVKESVFAGDRYGALIGSVKKSYGVSENKAKFLARQETKLLVTTFQEARYADAGIHEYTWHSVIGSPAHPVRKRHKELNDMKENGQKKIFRFDNPPNTAELGQPARHNNPGQDYNCRCFAKPVVRFKR